MDFNYLYYRRGTSLMMAARATCARSRAAHLDLAERYVANIARLRSAQRVQIAA